jgi:hypothetical protein
MRTLGLCLAVGGVVLVGFGFYVIVGGPFRFGTWGKYE